MARDGAVRDWRAWAKTTARLQPATINNTLAAIDDFYARRGLGAATVRREALPRRAPKAVGSRDVTRHLRAVEHCGSARNAVVALLVNCRGGQLSDARAGTPRGDAQVSLFLPTHRFGSAIEADKLQWENLIAGVETILEERMRRPEIEALLAPARRLQSDGMAWEYMSDGLAMFLRSDWHRTFRVSTAMPALGTVGDRLVIEPMLRLLSGDEHFLLLALSQREIRLMEGSRHTVEQIELTNVSTSLNDVVRPQEPRSDTMARPAAAAGQGGPAVFYGHGAGDRDLKNDEVVRFVREVSTGLREVLAGQTAPMVLAGPERLVAAYREVNTYGYLLEDAVDHNPDQLSIEQLHRMAWPVVEQRLRDERAQVIERFRGLHSAGLVSADLPTVAEAADQGRVETLFVKVDPSCWERVAGVSPAIVRLDADEQYAECEQVDAAAVATLNNGGKVHATSSSVVPDSQVAAIFRY